MKPKTKALFKMKTFPPACEYCAKGKPSPDGGSVLCPLKGIMLNQSRCGKYQYDPLKRRPARTPALPEFEPEQFVL
ncbi:MAG: hypothetical protein FWH26_01025 [Oscillospiraceae bacterium]|nr:hypothetical protein [Oscillospiraceae bacterium]